MSRRFLAPLICLLVLRSAVAAPPRSNADRRPDGDNRVEVSGELKQWHKVTFTLDGPFARETDTEPNPFTDIALDATFTHESGSPAYVIPGHFAADGDAANTSAASGTKWRVHVSPDKPGMWRYTLSLRRGEQVAVKVPQPRDLERSTIATGTFLIAATDKSGRDFRARGRLQYVGRRYLQFAGSGEYFLKAGPDAPETLLAYADFDDTHARKGSAPLKTWSEHERDWRDGDPTWQTGKGKGLIGALNYLAARGVNTFSFLPYNAGGDGDNVWPFVSRHDKLHYDCSKLDQWGVVFDHATARGLHLHFKLQENEMDDDRLGPKRENSTVPESLDGGRLGPERKLYCRELVSRFSHNLALNWNIGEENTQSTQEIVEMVHYLHAVDPYDHNIVIHTFPPQQDQVYTPLLGDASELTGVSLQNSWDAVHRRTLHWITRSQAAGRPWVVANDEQNPASLGVPPDPGYQGHDPIAIDRGQNRQSESGGGYTLHDIRKLTLWGNLMAGGAGVEYYFGYQLPQNDLTCEDFRSRDRSWDYCRIALDFFREQEIPIDEMENADRLVGNPSHDNSRYCFARTGELYLVYLPDGGTTTLDTSAADGVLAIRWFNPRAGGTLKTGSLESVTAGPASALGDPPSDPAEDWLVLVRKRGSRE